MPLVTIDVSRIKLAAAALDAIDPNRELRDPTNQALRLSAIQNAGGTVTAPSVLLDRVEELLKSPISDLNSQLPGLPESVIAECPIADPIESPIADPEIPEPEA